MTKNDILAAAFKVWARDMYRKMSLTDVAQALGVTKPALYRHFSNKDALLDAMYVDFFDRYAAYLRAGIREQDPDGDVVERMVRIIPAVVEYYVRNRDDFVFSFAQVLGNPHPGRNIHRELGKRGIPVGLAGDSGDEGEPSPAVLLAGVTAFFFVAIFHLERGEDAPYPSEEAIRAVAAGIADRIRGGLGYRPEEIAALDLEALGRWARVDPALSVGGSSLLRAVASAVAEAGPWNASMDQVAKRSGLSKSGLYAHFKNKQDMLRQLFMSEFERITEIVEDKASRSEVPAERLYLAMAAIHDYLRARPDILVTMDWIRIQRLDLGILVPQRLFRIFESIQAPSGGGQLTTMSVVNLTRWILFLVVNVLMMEMGPCRESGVRVPPIGLPMLFRYTTLGVEGWSL